MSNSKLSIANTDYYKNLPPGPWIEQLRNYGPSLDEIPWMEGDDEELEVEAGGPSELQLNEVIGEMETEPKTETQASVSIPVPTFVQIPVTLALMEHVASEHNYVLKTEFKQEKMEIVSPVKVNNANADFEFEENMIESQVKDFNDEGGIGMMKIEIEPPPMDDFGLGFETVTAAADGLEKQLDLKPYGIQNDILPLPSFPVQLAKPSVNSGKGRVNATPIPSPSAKRIKIEASGKTSTAAAAVAATKTIRATRSSNKVVAVAVPLILKPKLVKGQQKQTIGLGQQKQMNVLQQQNKDQQKQTIDLLKPIITQSQQKVNLDPGQQIENQTETDNSVPVPPFLIVNNVTEVTAPTSTVEAASIANASDIQPEIAAPMANDSKIQAETSAVEETERASAVDPQTDKSSDAASRGNAKTKKDKKPSNWMCYHCEVSFQNRKKLREHTLTVEDETFRCRYCNDMIPTFYCWKRHEGIHTRKRKIGTSERCQICRKFCSTREILLTHLLEHTGENKFKCELCPRTFRYDSGRKRHALSHTGEQPFGCNYCEQHFGSTSARNRHEFVHIMDRFGINVPRKNQAKPKEKKSGK